MAEQGGAKSYQAGPGLPAIPIRALELRDGLDESLPAPGPLADVPRIVIDTAALAQIVRPRGGGELNWSALRAELWERALRDSGLFAVLHHPDLAPGPRGPGDALLAIRERLEHVRALEKKLGENAEEGEARTQREMDMLTVALCAAGIGASLAPFPLDRLAALALLLIGARSAWKTWSPGVRVGREDLRVARQELAHAIQRFLERTWVAALGDSILESTPHAVYFFHRLTDLDAARGSRVQELRDVRALIERIHSANRSIGREPDDGETRRLARQIEELQAKIALIERVRAACAAQQETHLRQLDRQRALAARRALSSRASAVVEHGDEDVADHEIAEIEVDIVGLAAQIRGLEVDIGDADAELRALLELAHGGASRARPRLRA